MLRVPAGEDPSVPPPTGWKFYNGFTKTYDEDPNLNCGTLDTSPPCCISVNLSGLAKDFQGECEGEYKDTGMSSCGWKVDK